jgi:penicillin-insensitive murein DD-endopeptidase
VNPAIKKWLCENSKGDRSYLTKVTAIMGHDAHFHVRLACPAGNPGCENQALKADEGCGKGLDQWIAGLMKPPPGVPATKLAAIRAKIAAWKGGQGGHKPKPPFPMGQLPAECETVLKAQPSPAPDATAAR